MKEEKLKITFPDGNTIETAKNTVASELLKNINGQDSRVLAMRLNNKIYSLEKKIKYSGKIEPVFIDTKDGANIYRRSLCLLLAAATHRLYPEYQLLVGHSLGYGYYYTFRNVNKISAADIALIEEEMRRMVQQDIPIETDTIS